MTAAYACASLTTDSVDFIDKYDARRIFLSLLEQITHTRGTDADKHFDKVGAADAEKRYSRLACYCSGEQSFTGTWRSE